MKRGHQNLENQKNGGNGNFLRPRKVLVLGSVAMARLIGEELEGEGFQVYLHEEDQGPSHQYISPSPLPDLRDPNGLEKLRAIFIDFLDKHSEGGRFLCYVHPGTSIWGERPELPILGQELGIQVICPPARVLSLFGNKLSFLSEAEKLGIPNLLLSPDPMHSLREIEQKKFSYPMVLKAIKGGLVAGHYVVHDAEELRSGFALWAEQLRSVSGEVILLAERYLEGARQLVLPFVRFLDGRFQTFPIVDASLQCRHRKMIEFCPAPAVDLESVEKVNDWTKFLAEASGYVGVGTLEFLVDSSRAYLIGGSARLNQSFRIWEEVAGTRAVNWQLAAFEGHSEERCQRLVSRVSHRKWNYAVSVRLYSEDPILQLPQPGFLQEMGEQRHWVFPNAEAILDLSVKQGHSISPFSSGFLGTLTVGVEDSSQLITVARGVLEEIWFAGSLHTNERFIAELFDHPWVQEGVFHSGFVDEDFLPAIRPPHEFLQVFATVCSLIHVKENLGTSDSGVRWAVGDQWVKPDPHCFKWTESPQFWTRTDQEGQGTGLSGWVEISSGRKLRICAFPTREGRWQVRLGNWVLIVRRVVAGAKTSEGKFSRITALVPGRVHSLLFQEGAFVPAHEPLLMIESLRTQVPHAVPVDIRILRWKVSAEDVVQAGDDVLDFEVVTKI